MVVRLHIQIYEYEVGNLTELIILKADVNNLKYMPKPTNAVLAQKIDDMKEFMALQFKINAREHSATNTHLKELNGKVYKNTEARHKLKLYWISGVIVAGGFGGLASGELKSLIFSLLGF